jgi:hypothetical protein
VFSAVGTSKDPSLFIAGYSPRAYIDGLRIVGIEDYAVQRQAAFFKPGTESSPGASAVSRSENLSVPGAQIKQVGVIGRDDQRPNIATPGPCNFPLPNFLRVSG